MKILTQLVLLFVGLIHLLPLIGVLGHAELKNLYGVEALDNNLTVLLRHRAVLFGLLGAFILSSVFITHLHWPALLMALVSAASFIVLSAGDSELAAGIQKVVTVDVVCVVALCIVIVLKLALAA